MLRIIQIGMQNLKVVIMKRTMQIQKLKEQLRNQLVIILIYVKSVVSVFVDSVTLMVLLCNGMISVKNIN